MSLRDWTLVDGFLARLDQELRFHHQLLADVLPLLPLPEEAA